MFRNHRNIFRKHRNMFQKHRNMFRNHRNMFRNDRNIFRKHRNIFRNHRNMFRNHWNIFWNHRTDSEHTPLQPRGQHATQMHYSGDPTMGSRGRETCEMCSSDRETRGSRACVCAKSRELNGPVHNLLM